MTDEKQTTPRIVPVDELVFVSGEPKRYVCFTSDSYTDEFWFSGEKKAEAYCFAVRNTITADRKRCREAWKVEWGRNLDTYKIEITELKAKVAELELMRMNDAAAMIGTRSVVSELEVKNKSLAKQNKKHEACKNVYWTETTHVYDREAFRREAALRMLATGEHEAYGAVIQANKLIEALDAKAVDEKTHIVKCCKCNEKIRLIVSDGNPELILVEGWVFTSKDGWLCPGCVRGCDAKAVDDV